MGTPDAAVVLNYTDDLLLEDEIAAAVEVARTHFDPDEVLP